MKKKYTRQCKNWLQTFRDWTVPRSEAKESFIFWSGLFALSSALRRHVCIPNSLLGSWSIYPHLYVMFVSPPGRGRKTTTMGYADDLLEDIPNLVKSSSAMTQQVLVKRLSEAPDNSISIRSSEFGTFYSQSKEVMIDFLTDIFDGKKRHESDTLIRGQETAEKPCINLLAATTPKWISQNLSENAVGGGFASRVIFVYEDKVRRRKLYYDDLDQKQLKDLRSDLYMDLLHISEELYGDFEIDDEAKKWMSDWYEGESENPRTYDPRMTGYQERKPAYIHKVAMLCHIAESDKLVLHKHDFEMAIAIMNGVEKKMLQAFQSFGKNQYTADMDDIKDYIKMEGKTDIDKIKSRFRHVALPFKIEELVEALVLFGDVREIKRINKPDQYYVIDPSGQTNFLHEE